MKEDGNMTSYEMSQKLSQLLDVLGDDNEIVSLLAEMANIYDDLIPILNELLKVDYKTQEQAANAINVFFSFIKPKQEQVGKIVGKLKIKRPAKTLIMLDKLVDDLQELSHSEGHDLETFSSIKIKIQNFYQLYEGSINNYTWPQTLKLLTAAKDLYDSISVYRDFVYFIKEDLEPAIDVPQGNKVASFFFQSTTEYEEFLNKLLALDRLYSELCLLANVSKSQYPLRVIKIESGSLRIKLFGESKVIKLLTSLIESAAGFFYRNFTNEGKIKSIPRGVEAIESVLALTKKLEAEGIDVSASKDNLQKAAVIMSAQLNKLLLKEPSIEVDGKKYSVAEAMQDKYLLEGQRLLLDEGNKRAE
jgi:hypothetical protein